MRAEGTNSPGEAASGGWTAAWELLLPTSAAPAGRRGQVLQEALREAVRSGRLAAGTRLPPSRELARDLGVSRGLVTDAYEQLAAEGYLVSVRGAGTWVGEAARPIPRSVASEPAGRRAPEFDLRPLGADLSLFPRTRWAAAQRRALDRAAHAELGYPDPRGLPELRQELAGLLARRRGVVAAPEQVVVCSGVAQALSLLGLTLRGRGLRTVAVERPGPSELPGLFDAVGLRAVPVPVDGQGLEARALEESGARLAVLTPAHQFPTGVACSPARRAELLDWARRRDGLLVEDDYDGDFRYDRQPVGALQGLDPERVAYAGSVSKSLAPALRLGWLVVPPALVDAVVARKRTLDLGHPALDQAVLAELLRRGDYDRQLRRCQRAYRERRDVLVAALGSWLPAARVTGVAAGLHAIVTLPARYGPTASLVARAGRGGVALRPLAEYGVAEAADGSVQLVFGFAHLAPGRLGEAVARLAECAEARSG
ncbi:PLP-dependent aminotransferase family protein [Streptomyces alkaliterrae]|uniref:Aminotransferase class I/II-fold pyridoxal phosphate-dependent enzyme n=1 Tax=Streptomyces alkaliterrae TaxID=2213162 RepID=A0A5P0YR00_9ACTN|nr:PLP-dependent aminotransferase family protein [Streptomyces alkaliterrae]MBB1257339.1 PLP-dependent aminotransferase family protein [Streptomyces alkaliterrae]MQS02047.1 aminotransferase class I/II-fold pyridoxal phosphate-dependent enzyme [Streptomyces alkaliterrae]